MLDAGGGGGGVATPWYDYALPKMWEIVNSQDTDALWQRASGWKKTIELTSLHKYNLEQYKEQLAEAWPPERSEASRAYMAELDKLIGSVQETNEAASANYSAVVSIALAVGDAKYKLKPLYDEYQSNEQKLANYNQQVESYNADTTATPQPSPGPPPVDSGRQEELNNQARSIMYSIGGEITTAGAALKPPRPYTPPPGGIDDGDGGSGGGGTGGGGGALVPPLIPPARPASPPAGPTLSLQPMPSASPPPSTPPGIGQGPILGGTPTPMPTSPPPVNAPPVIQPSPVPGPTPGLPPGPIGPMPSTYNPASGLPPKAALPTTGLINGAGPGPKGLGGMAGKVGPRAMPPGGVIGGQPGSGLARPGAGRPVSRINPPGGMIGGQPGAGRGAATGKGAAVGKGAAGVPAGRSARHHDEEAPVLHWDPDNPWETEEGVAPVVLPPEEPKRHDPGPAIGQGR